MNNLSTSFIILAIALTLLWLAVTDRLSRVLDAWQVITGKAGVTDKASTVASALQGTPVGTASFGGAGGGTLMQLPTLPQLGTLQA